MKLICCHVVERKVRTVEVVLPLPYRANKTAVTVHLQEVWLKSRVEEGVYIYCN
jgi:hypothetical protein